MMVDSSMPTAESARRSSSHSSSTQAEVLDGLANHCRQRGLCSSSVVEVNHSPLAHRSDRLLSGAEDRVGHVEAVFSQLCDSDAITCSTVSSLLGTSECLLRKHKLA